jgi:hypothetical protein
MSPLPLPNPAERRPQLAIIFPANGEKQTAVDVPTITGALTDAIAVNSPNWFETAITVEEIFDCLGEDPTDEEVTRILYRLPITGNFYAPLIAKLGAYAYGVAGAPTGIEQNTIQTVTIDAGAGRFKLALTHLGGTETTGWLPWDATAAQMRQALEALPNIGNGNVTVGKVGLVYTIQFVGKRKSFPVPAFVPTSELTGGAGTATVAVTQAGSQKASNITRNPGYQNPYFSFAIGFRDSADSSFVLCYNAVVNNLRITAPANQGIVTWSAEIIFSGQAPLLDFAPPDCYTPATVRTGDCDFIYDGGSQNPSLVDMEFVFDNGILTGDFAYTGRRIVPTRLERAIRRTSGITVTLTGKKSDPIYTDGAPPFRKNVPITAIFGTEGENFTVNAPNALWKWGANSGLAFEGEGEETRLKLVGAPKRSGAIHPTNAVANVNLPSGLLAAA